MSAAKNNSVFPSLTGMPSPRSMVNDWSAWLQVKKKKVFSKIAVESENNTVYRILENPTFNISKLIPSIYFMDKITCTTLSGNTYSIILGKAFTVTKKQKGVMFKRNHVLCSYDASVEHLGKQ